MYHLEKQAKQFCIKASIFLIAMLVSSASVIAATSSGISYQGRILKPNGEALEGANVQFRFQLRTPDTSNCLMYEEQQMIDMRNSKGSFALTMNDGSGVRVDSTGWGLDKIFANRGSFTFNPVTCSSGSTYAPNENDGRNLVVYFKDETMATWEPIAAQSINYVPYAFEAKQIAGFGAANLLRFAESDGTLVNTSPLNNGQYTELLALVNGTSTRFAKAGELAGVALPTLGAGQAGQVLSWTGTGWTTAASSVGADSVSSTNIVNGSITGADLATNIAISTTNTIATSGTVSSNVSTARDFRIYDSDTAPNENYISIKAPTSLAANYNYIWPIDYGTANQVLTTDGTGALTWTTAASQWVNGTAGAIGYAGGFVGIGTTAPSSRLEVAATVTDYVAKITNNSASASSQGVWIDAKSGNAGTLALRVTNSSNSREILTANGAGRVGIGTTTPTKRLEVSKSDTTLYLSQSSTAVTPTTSLGAAIEITNSSPTDGAGAYLNFRTRGSSGDNNAYIGSKSRAGYAPDIMIGTQTDATSYAEHLRISGAGDVGIGTTAPAAKLDVAGTFNIDTNITDPAGGGSASMWVNANPSSAPTGPYIANYWGMDYTSNFNAPSIFTNYYELYHSGNGVVTNAYGSISDVYNSGAGSITNAYGLYSRIRNQSASGAITNSYSVFISAPEVIGPITNSYGLYQEGVNDKNFFGGKVGVGMTAPSALLHLKSGTAAANSAPIKFTSGTLLTTPEDGAVEYNSASGLWFTIGSTRYLIPVNTAAGNYSNVQTIGNTSGSITMTPLAGNSVIVNSAAVSTSSTTGAFVVNGGVGVAGAINSAGNMSSGGTVSATNSMITPQIYGSSAASGNIKIDGTSNATKGDVLLSSAGGAVGIGSTSPRGEWWDQKLLVEKIETLPSGRSWYLDSAITGALNQNVSSLLPTDTDLWSSAGTFNGVLSGSAAVPGYSTIMGVNASATLDNGVDLTATASYVLGIQAFARARNTSKATEVRALQVYAGSYDSAQVTNMYGIWVNRNFGLSSSPVQNNYGVYIQEQTYGTNKYNLYSQGTSGKNIFEGSVGIGTSAPSTKLDVRGSATFTAGAGQTSVIGLGNAGTITGSPVAGINGTAYIASTASNTAGLPTDLAFYTTTGGVAAPRLTILPAGNVGIGTTSPSTMLTVAGSVTSGNISLGNGSGSTSPTYLTLRGPAGATDSYNLFQFLNYADSKAWSLDNRNGNPNATEANQLRFRYYDGTTTSFPMTLAPTGNVGVGTTVPTQKLMVAGNITPEATDTRDLGTSTLLFNNAYVKNGVTTTSDARKKTEIRDSDLGLQFVNSLRPVSYFWKQGDKDLHYGVIAQEAEQALIRAKSRSGRSPSEADNVIVTHDKKTDAYGVRYTELIAPIIKAIQELYSDSRAKDQEILKLRQENAAIKAYLCSKDPEASLCR